MTPTRRDGARTVAIAFVCAVFLTGCATVSPDPLEGLNRATFAFNEQVDEVVLRPVAICYTGTVPAPLRQGIANMIANPGTAASAINGLLEGEVSFFLDDGTRFAVNSTFGVLGFFDVASQMSIEGHYLTFAKTLRRWGVPAGPYVVLPLLGPYDGRALAALPLDTRLSLSGWVTAPAERIVVASVTVTSRRSQLLGVTKLIDELAFDKYLFVRDAYLQSEGVALEQADATETEPGSEPDVPNSKAR